MSGAWPLDGLMSYLGHSLEFLTPLQKYCWFILEAQPTGLYWFGAKSHSMEILLCGAYNTLADKTSFQKEGILGV